MNPLSICTWLRRPKGNEDAAKITSHPKVEFLGRCESGMTMADPPQA